MSMMPACRSWSFRPGIGSASNAVPLRSKWYWFMSVITTVFVWPEQEGLLALVHRI
jgi:hypothetical protein